MMTETGKIKVWQSHNDSVWNIQLHAPKANVLDTVMLSEISKGVAAAGENANCKLIVFSAEGPHFSFGASVEEHRREYISEMLRTFHGLLYLLMDIGIPTLALVRGHCLGGGLELACFCNFVFADMTAVFAVPEIKLGVFPPAASAFLPLIIGQRHADHMILTGCDVSAEEALRIGLINQAVDATQLQDTLEHFITTDILPKSASSLRYAVKASRWEYHRQVKDLCQALESYYIQELMETPDANEGIQAFLEKRNPTWQSAP